MRGNTVYIRGGGIYNFGRHAMLTLNGASSVTRNGVSGSGGGIYNAATVTLSGTSSVSDNKASGNGGGIDDSGGATSMQATVSVTGNIADIDRDGEGVGGGIFSCGDTLTGAVDGGNVDGNHLRRATGTENNIASCP